MGSLQKQQSEKDQDIDVEQYINDKTIRQILDVVSVKRSSLSRRMNPDELKLAMHHQIITSNIGLLTPGKVIVVYRGETIPCDGYILYGSSPIDESFISKIHHGKAKGPGDRVYAGTKVLSSDIFVCACAVGNDTLIGHLICSIKRSTINANKRLEQRDDLHFQYQNRRNLMKAYQWIVLALSLIMTTVWTVLSLTSKKLQGHIFNAYGIGDPQSQVVRRLAYAAFVVQTFTGIIVVSSPITYSMCFSLVSLIGTSVFSKMSMIIRDCARVCQKL